MKLQKLTGQLRGFLIDNQWRFSVITLVALAFLYLKQTRYFDPFFEVPFLIIFLFLWIFSIFLFKIRPPFSFGLAILFLLISLFLLLVGIKPWAERAALYAYGFFVIGVIQGLIAEVFVDKRN